MNWRVRLIPTFNTGALSCWRCAGGVTHANTLLSPQFSEYLQLSSQKEYVKRVVGYNYLVFQGSE